MTLTLDRIEGLEQDLSSRAFLYDDPATFRAAIDLAMQMVREVATSSPRATAMGSDATDEHVHAITGR